MRRLLQEYAKTERGMHSYVASTCQLSHPQDSKDSLSSAITQLKSQLTQIIAGEAMLKPQLDFAGEYCKIRSASSLPSWERRTRGIGCATAIALAGRGTPQPKARLCCRAADQNGIFLTKLGGQDARDWLCHSQRVSVRPFPVKAPHDTSETRSGGRST